MLHKFIAKSCVCYALLKKYISCGEPPLLIVGAQHISKKLISIMI